MLEGSLDLVVRLDYNYYMIELVAPLLPRRRKEEEEIHRQLAEIERRKAEEAERKVMKVLHYKICY